MSLKTLLAVGESFSGTGDKSYEVKERQIPIFARDDGGTVAAKKASQDLATAIPDELQACVPQVELDFANAAPVAPEPTVPTVEPEKPEPKRIHLAPERRRIEQEPDERRRFLKRWSKPSLRRLTQAEMALTLENVRVVRNDLSDADLELAPRRASRGPQSDLNPFAPRPIAAIGRPAHEKLGMGERVARWFRFLKKPRS
jgi:hypothetical protein